MQVTDEMVEVAARATCAHGGFDPDERMSNDGPRWRYYLDGARAALTAALSAEQTQPVATLTRAEAGPAPYTNVRVKPTIAVGTYAITELYAGRTVESDHLIMEPADDMALVSRWRDGEFEATADEAAQEALDDQALGLDVGPIIEAWLSELPCQKVEEVSRMQAALQMIASESNWSFGKPIDSACAENYARIAEEMSAIAKGALSSSLEAREHPHSALVDVPAEPVAKQWCAYEDGHQYTSWYPDGYGDRAGWEALAKRNPTKYQVATRALYTSPPLSREGEDTAEVIAALEFVALWAWREDPPAAARNLSDGERLSAIKYHPTIKALAATRSGSATIAKGGDRE